MEGKTHATTKETHLTPIGYLLWFFGGIFGYHRFYYGRQLTGLLWMLTAGVFFIGWIVDAFLIPGMNRDANNQFKTGETDYSVAWVLMLFWVSSAPTASTWARSAPGCSTF